jgi:Arc/MetJ-type ribon-helix-helix transcriptional regulator
MPKQIGIRVDDDLLKAIDEMTTKELSRSAVVRTLIRKALNQIDPPTPGKPKLLEKEVFVGRVEHKQVDLDPAKKPTAASVAKAVEDFATHGTHKALERKEVDPRPK